MKSTINRVLGLTLLAVVFGAACSGEVEPKSSEAPVTETETVTVTAKPSTVTKAPKTVTKTKTKTVTQTVTQDAAAPVAPDEPGAPSQYYANCSEARAAGAAPLRRGDSGYASHLDRDNDGVACE